MPLRCLIVDDNVPFLEAATTLLQRQGLTVAGVASNGAQALRLVGELRPDVVILDVVLGAESGLEVARELAASDAAGPTVVLVSTHSESDFEDLILETPAAGFVSKDKLSADAIRRLAA